MDQLNALIEHVETLEERQRQTDAYVGMLIKNNTLAQERHKLLESNIQSVVDGFVDVNTRIVHTLESMVEATMDADGTLSDAIITAEAKNANTAAQISNRLQAMEDWVLDIETEQTSKNLRTSNSVKAMEDWVNDLNADTYSAIKGLRAQVMMLGLAGVALVDSLEETPVNTDIADNNAVESTGDLTEWLSSISENPWDEDKDAADTGFIQPLSYEEFVAHINRSGI